MKLHTLQKFSTYMLGKYIHLLCSKLHRREMAKLPVQRQTAPQKAPLPDEIKTFQGICAAKTRSIKHFIICIGVLVPVLCTSADVTGMTVSQ